MIPQEYMHKAGVPLKFVKAKLNNLDFTAGLNKAQKDRYTKLYGLAKNIVKDYKFGILIEGMPGSGKSFFGAAILREYINEGLHPARTTSVEISEWYFKDFQGFRQRFIVSDILFVDDVARCGGTNANPAVVAKLLKDRDDQGRITIYACDSDKQLSQVFSEPTVRLIKGTTIALSLPAVDLRQIELQKYAEKLK